MATNSMYENLLALPLFKGVSYNRMSEIVGKTKLAFMKHAPGDVIVRAGEPCTGLLFVIKGSVRLVITAVNDRFRIGQTIATPGLISPDFLFGRDTLYPGEVSAIDEVSLLSIAKADFTTLLRGDDVILFNYLNIISTNAQKAIDGVMGLSTGSLEERIAFWIIALTQMGSDNIVLRARKSNLAAIFGVQRSALTSALDSLRDQGIIEYTADEITVLDRRALRNILLKVSI